MDLIDKFYAKIIWADKITKKIQYGIVSYCFLQQDELLLNECPFHPNQKAAPNGTAS